MLTWIVILLGALWSNAAAVKEYPPRGNVELLGYLENWVDVRWWDNSFPGNCRMGCFNAKELLNITTDYSALNYGFVFLTPTPAPEQLDCNSSKWNTKCPVWDGKNIYIAAASKQFSVVIDFEMAAWKLSPGAIAIADAVRLARMHPSGHPKRFKITIGGWSDFARLKTPANGKKVAKLMAKLVALTFADGVDIDFEHLTEFSRDSGDDEFTAFNAFIAQLRVELDEVEKSWVSNAAERREFLISDFEALQPWQRKAAVPFFNTTIEYLAEIENNPVPQLEISWTTRFNAFVPPEDPFNYLLANSSVPNVTFATDNEGLHVWNNSGRWIDTVNIMAYDAGGLSFNFSKILQNFVQLGGVPAGKINLGFEPGEQAAGGVWEGLITDMNAAKYIKKRGFGGVMLWAANPNPRTNPRGAVDCPKEAAVIQKILQPTPAWGPGKVGDWTRVDPNTGWLPGL